MNKPYLPIAGDNYYPSSDTGDWVGCFSLIMTDEQILELVKEHFIEWKADEDGYCWVEFAGKPNAFLKFAREVCQKNDFYKTRCELLQKVQKYMRDPERQIVCDILANNSLLPDPFGVRYGQDLVKLIETNND